MTAKVLIHPSTYETVREAVDRAFELFAPEMTGRKVMIKPNVLRSSEAGEGIVTHPAVLRAVVEAVERRKPSSLIVGDNPGIFSYGDNERSFEKTGLMAAAGPYYRNIGHDARVVPFDGGLMDTVSVSSAILDADVVISLPKFKTHGLTVLTGAIKNSYGILPGAQKAALHRLAGNPERFHLVVVDVFRLRPPDFFIVDAVVGMEGNGPASPELRDIGKILASDNAVALDATIARMMGLDPGRLRFLRAAREAGLGNFAEEAIEILGELEPIPNFKVPPLGGEALMNNPAVQDMLHGKTLLRPKADPETCVGCGDCADHCPVSALVMTDGLPVVEASRCIACFCCQEICPEKAITLR